MVTAVDHALPWLSRASAVVVRYRLLAWKKILPCLRAYPDPYLFFNFWVCMYLCCPSLCECLCKIMGMPVSSFIHPFGLCFLYRNRFCGSEPIGLLLSSLGLGIERLSINSFLLPSFKAVHSAIFNSLHYHLVWFSDSFKFYLLLFFLLAETSSHREWSTSSTGACVLRQHDRRGSTAGRLWDQDRCAGESGRAGGWTVPCM